MVQPSTPISFGLTVPFELSPAWYAAYLRSANPEREYGIPVVHLDNDAPTKLLAHPQPGFILIVDRLYWCKAADRREQRRGECEDGISWLSSSSTRPCVISLPCGGKLVTEYLYRRDRALGDDAVRALQKHEIWLCDESYELVTKTGEAVGSSARTSIRRPTTPMPSRCLVHYIDKKHAVHHMKPPRVQLVRQPNASYVRAEDTLLASVQLKPLIALPTAGAASTRAPSGPALAFALAAATPRATIAEPLMDTAMTVAEPVSRASPAEHLFFEPVLPARAVRASHGATVHGPVRSMPARRRSAREGILASPRALGTAKPRAGAGVSMGVGACAASSELNELATAGANPLNTSCSLNRDALGFAGQAIYSQDLATFLERDEDILGALFSFESS